MVMRKSFGLRTGKPRNEASRIPIKTLAFVLIFNSPHIRIGTKRY